MVALGLVASRYVSACAVLCSVAGKLLGDDFCLLMALPPPTARETEGPALQTSASSDLSYIGARRCIACRDVALMLQHNLPRWRRGLQGHLAALYQGATSAAGQAVSQCEVPACLQQLLRAGNCQTSTTA